MGTPEQPADPPTPVPVAGPRVVSIPPPFDRYAGQMVVIDTTSSFLFLGTLIGADDWFVELAEVDCHDRTEGHSTNEKYAMEAAKYGLKVNRKRVAVLRHNIVSIARLDDVVKY